MIELESPFTAEHENQINKRGNKLIAQLAAWEYDNWPTRYIEVKTKKNIVES
jgi:hypothetical protein